MSHDTITLSLQGDVPIVDFASAMQHLSGLVSALSEEVAGPSLIEWEIARLQGGSATVALRGSAQDPADVDRIIRAYMVVGAALAEDTPIPYSDEVIDHARALTAFINGKVKSVQFSVNGQVATVTVPRSAVEGEPGHRRHALGVITGIVETLSGRGSLTCTIYDPLFDKAVKCYIDINDKETLRKAWGQRVAITGDIERDTVSGRPTVVRNVRRIEVQEKWPRDSYKRARGVLPWLSGDELPEIHIRRNRDAD